MNGLNDASTSLDREDNPRGERISTSQREFLLISGHDYRSKRRASAHFIASSLKRFGKVNFYSIGFSFLSRLKQDPRADLWPESNRACEFEDVGCYLEQNLIHPFNTNSEWLKLPEALWFEAYKIRPRPQLWNWVNLADTIIFESGISVLLAEQISLANPKATKIYLTSDDLRTIGCSDHLIRCLDRSAASFDYAVLPSKLLGPAMPPGMKLVDIPHGLDQKAFATEQRSPYPPGMNAVSVGSMLFDAGFFEIACQNFPEVKFYVIGGGHEGSRVNASNTVVLPEMAFSETIRYIKHASIGIAPYAAESAPYYLSDTSMKLMQYRAAGKNAVCPFFADDKKAGRFGYNPGHEESIVRAIRQALTTPPVRPANFLNWDDVTDRILSPDDYPDTKM